MNIIYKSAIFFVLGVFVLPVNAGGIFASEAEDYGMSGSVGFFAGSLGYETTDDDYDDSDPVVGGTGMLNLTFASVFSIQADGLFEQVLHDGNKLEDNDEATLDNIRGFGLHGSIRKEEIFNIFNQPIGGLIGAFGGWGGGTPTDEESWSGSWIGGEAQIFINRLTLYGQYADLHFESGDDDEEGLQDDAHMYRTVARYYITDEILIEGGYSFFNAQVTIDGDDAGNGKMWEARVEGKLYKLPVYGFLTYRNADIESKSEDDFAEVDSIMVGINYYFGGGSKQTLMARDRAAGLSTPTVHLLGAGTLSELD